MEKYIKLTQDFYGGLKGDILKYKDPVEGDISNTLYILPSKRTSTSMMKPYVSMSSISIYAIVSTEEEWNKQEGIKINPKFIAGKWYKIFDNWYAKFKVIHFSGKYWRFSEKIALNTGYSNIESQFDNWENTPIVELTDLSEIQQYLPQNHPDLIKKESVFLAGNWYNISYRYKGKECNIFFLLEKYINNYLYFKNGKYINTSGDISEAICLELDSKIKDVKILKTDKSPFCENTRKLNLVFDSFNPCNEIELPKENSKNLDGRWFRAIKDAPQGTRMKKGDYIQIENSLLLTFKPWGAIGYKKYWSYSTSEIGKSWELMPEGFIPPGELTSLPTKWYIRPTAETTSILEKWRGGGYNDSCSKVALLSTKIWVLLEGIQDFKEITFEQFQKWVLNTEKKAELMETNLEKAKRLYPIGTRYNDVRGVYLNTIADNTPNLLGNGGIEVGLGYVYYDGKWAEIIEDTTIKQYPVTPEEATKYNYTVVHCKTQEEWDFVIESKIDKKYQLYKEKSRFQEYLQEYPEGIAINIKDASWSDISWWIKNNTYVYSFEEWCSIYGYGITTPIVHSREHTYDGEKYIVEIDPIENKTPIIRIDAEVSTIKINKVPSVTLKNSDREVNIKVNNTKQLIKF